MFDVVIQPPEIIEIIIWLQLNVNLYKYMLNRKDEAYPKLEWEKKHLPSELTAVYDVAFLICFPLTIHLISAGGLEGAVEHCSWTTSFTRASDGPDMVTCVGATVINNININ